MEKGQSQSRYVCSDLVFFRFHLASLQTIAYCVCHPNSPQTRRKLLGRKWLPAALSG